MKKIIAIFGISLVLTFLHSSDVLADPDQYVGDTSIYGGNSAPLEPNLLIILDTSGSMNDEALPGNPYGGHSVDYSNINGCGANPCVRDTVYKCTAWGLECGNWVAHIASSSPGVGGVNNVNTSCPSGVNPRNSLITTGMWNSGSKRLTTSGACSNGSGIYATGNWINWRGQQGVLRPKIDIAKSVVTNLLDSTFGIKIGLMIFNNNQGSKIYSASVGGSTYVATVKHMDDIFSGTTTNRQALVTAVSNIDADSWTPLAESLFEAMRYYRGGPSAFANSTGITGGLYTSPIEAGCQKNYVVIVTDGMSTQDSDNVLQSICTTAQGYPRNGDCDRDSFEPSNDPAKNYENSGSDYLDDVAKYMYDNSMLSQYPGSNVITYTVGFGLGGANAGAVKLLNEAAANGAPRDSGGHPQQAFLANDEASLTAALQTVLSRIMEVNTSFVAPVVPVSPENRTYSGSRVYMGFFKPEVGKFWNGNLKKFGLDLSNNILDADGHLATYVTTTNPARDDRDGADVPSSASNGSFRVSSRSYWSQTADGGNVEDGGIGEVLLNGTTARNIVTYLGADPLLTNTVNAFVSSNITPTALGFAAGDTVSRDNLINFLNGQDAYDSDADFNMTEKRTWILGDVLHSKPQIVSYSSYIVVTDESDCTKNKTMLFVGADDGMLHAFRDCDGREEWACIPPDLLPVLQYLGPTGNAHSFLLESSPGIYVFNKMKDGVINPANGDKVFLLFGLRRGGGTDTSPATGYYYALNITDPLNPQFLWKINSATTNASELAESWSDATMGKIFYGSAKKIAAFIGAGYDNCNEDARYGNTQAYPGTCVSSPTSDSGATTSTGTSAPTGPKGRGVFIVDVATFDSNNIPQLTSSSGSIISRFTPSTVAGMNFSFPSRITALDKDYDGYTDTLYAGDAGGNLWRFNIKDTSTTNWNANKIFSANPGYTAPAGSITGSLDSPATNGRKILYEPSAYVLEDGTVRLFFGTGDREHPLNTAIDDRMYAVIDRGQTTASGINESRLADVTTDQLQDPALSQTQVSTILTALTSTTKYGWYIRLDQNNGEKVLAPSLFFNQQVVFTTYSPDAPPSSDPCVTGNLGTARVYIVDFLTGTAVINFDRANDTSVYSNAWIRASGSNYNLLRSDRLKTLGGGIPSAPVPIISSTGQTTLMVGVGGNLANVQTRGGVSTLPVYWRQKSEFYQ